tara:strand:+ start:719 stop:958 length:240 start_codon:yes stop_codon:yes gene_type:complete
MATKHGAFIIHGGYKPKEPWPNTTTTTIQENNAYALYVKKTWIGTHWCVEIIRHQDGFELSRLELYLDSTELKKLKESL